MKPRAVTDEDVALFGGVRQVFHCPPGMADCEPAEVIRGRADDGYPCIRLPWQPDEIELAALAQGSTVWLTLWGEGMPPVNLHVEAATREGTYDADRG